MSGESERTHSEGERMPVPSTSLDINRNPEKRPAFGSPTAIREGLNFVPLPKNLMECNSFDFLNEDEVGQNDPDVEFLDSEAQRKEYLDRVNRAARDLFAFKMSYNCRSIYLVDEVDWSFVRSCVALDRGYDCRIPGRGDRM